MKIKTVFRNDPEQRIFRLFRITWNRGVVGDGKGHSNAMSFDLCPSFFRFARDWTGGWSVRLLFVRVHRKISYGGIFN